VHVTIDQSIYTLIADILIFADIIRLVFTCPRRDFAPPLFVVVCS